jgi:hypothetical protein
MGLGFELEEELSGSYYRLDEPFKDLAMSVALGVGINGVRRFLRDRKMEARGTIFAEGLATRAIAGAPLHGTLTMRLFDEKRIPYDLSFEGDDGRTYRLRGQRDFFLHDAVDSLTILPASLYDDTGDEIARAMLRFDPKTELGPFLKSFRPRVRGARLAAGS